MGAELLDRLKPEDLHEDVQFLADVIGLDNVLKLLKLGGGMTFYIPTRVPSDFCRKYVLNHYDPGARNVKAIAGTLGITERQVYRILSSQGPRRAA